MGEHEFRVAGALGGIAAVALDALDGIFSFVIGVFFGSTLLTAAFLGLAPGKPASDRGGETRGVELLAFVQMADPSGLTRVDFPGCILRAGVLFDTLCIRHTARLE